MATRSKRPSKPAGRSKLMKAIADHPVAAAGIAAGAVAGAVLAVKAANTAAKVVTIKAAGKAATDVTRAVRRKK
jgi:hypothetical protein